MKHSQSEKKEDLNEKEDTMMLFCCFCAWVGEYVSEWVDECECEYG